MTPHESPTVACCIRDRAALKRVHLALEAEGAVVQSAEWRDVITQTAAVAGSAALVYDLEPHDQLASGVIAAFRECVKNGPVLLYPQASQRIAPLLEVHLGLRGVCLRLQREDPYEIRHLRHDVRRMLDMIPDKRLALLVRRALPPLHEPMAAFVEEIVRSLSSGQNEGRLLVDVMAMRAGTRKRTLERLSQASGLPQPKELLDWLILLYLGFVVEFEGLTWRAATRRVGIGKKTLYRMRHRLLPSRGAGGRRDYGLDAVLLAFAQRRANRTSSQQAGWQAAG